VLGGIVQPRRRLELSAEHHTEYFAQFDAALDAAVTGPRWLAEPEIARLVVEAAHHRDGKQYDLLAFCVIPNHVHMVLSVERNDISLYRILQSLKRYTAREANRVLGRHGPFWQHESYDHVIRDAAELDQTIWYVLYNPVKAGLSDAWEAWPWTYCKPGLIHQ
jgi:REP element-mobilizing transposase RayT